MQATSLSDWCYRCKACGTWASDLPVAVNETQNAIDELRREKALHRLRDHNNRLIIARLVTLGVQPGMSLMDVGCAHGWFIGNAAESGIRAEGIEPDLTVAAHAESLGHRVRRGFFPRALSAGEQFDVISFNDVLEHLPDPRAAVAASRAHLKPEGYLSINIPNSTGLVFRLAVALGRRGRALSLLKRLWQVGLPSPHLWYFDSTGLTRLCESQGFQLVLSDVLPSVTLSGLWARAHYDRPPSTKTVIGVVATALAAPVLNSRFGSDIMHLVFRRVE